MNFCVIIVNEIWIHYFTPETKEVNGKQWISPDEPVPKKAKTVKLAGKVIATVLDARGIIHIDYLPSKQTINGDYYSLIGPFQHFKEKTFHFIWRRRKYSSIKIMHGFTRAPNSWPNLTNSATNCFPIQHIRQI